jgi:hypothetical protein
LIVRVKQQLLEVYLKDGLLISHLINGLFILVIISFLDSAAWKADMVAGILATVLDHEAE